MKESNTKLQKAILNYFIYKSINSIIIMEDNEKIIKAKIKKYDDYTIIIKDENNKYRCIYKSSIKSIECYETNDNENMYKYICNQLNNKSYNNVKNFNK